MMEVSHHSFPLPVAFRFATCVTVSLVPATPVVFRGCIIYHYDLERDITASQQEVLTGKVLLPVATPIIAAQHPLHKAP